MEPVYFVMTILGCGDDGVQCRQERIEPVRYVSAAACQAAMVGALERNGDLAYPVIGAACQQQGRQVAETGVSGDRRRGG